MEVKNYKLVTSKEEVFTITTPLWLTNEETKVLSDFLNNQGCSVIFEKVGYVSRIVKVANCELRIGDTYCKIINYKYKTEICSFQHFQ